MRATLTIPESACEHVVVDGIPCIRVDAEMALEDLLLYVARTTGDGEESLVRIEEGSE